MQVAIYAGLPSANTAFSVAKRVYAELSGKEAADE
jgi:alkylhydroperoxidase/carboxymuconolactone decarboxylase family protein YurZ